MAAKQQQQSIVAASIAHFVAHNLNTFCCRGALGSCMTPDTIGCVWTGEVDLNTLRVDGEISESGKKKLWIQKYRNTCERGLNVYEKETYHSTVFSAQSR